MSDSTLATIGLNDAFDKTITDEETVGWECYACGTKNAVSRSRCSKCMTSVTYSHQQRAASAGRNVGAAQNMSVVQKDKSMSVDAADTSTREFAAANRPRTASEGSSWLGWMAGGVGSVAGGALKGVGYVATGVGGVAVGAMKTAVAVVSPRTSAAAGGDGAASVGEEARTSTHGLSSVAEDPQSKNVGISPSSGQLPSSSVATAEANAKLDALLGLSAGGTNPPSPPSSPAPPETVSQPAKATTGVSHGLAAADGSMSHTIAPDNDMTIMQALQATVSTQRKNRLRVASKKDGKAD